MLASCDIEFSSLFYGFCFYHFLCFYYPWCFPLLPPFVLFPCPCPCSVVFRNLRVFVLGCVLPISFLLWGVVFSHLLFLFLLPASVIAHLLGHLFFPNWDEFCCRLALHLDLISHSYLYTDILWYPCTQRLKKLWYCYTYENCCFLWCRTQSYIFYMHNVWSSAFFITKGCNSLHGWLLVHPSRCMIKLEYICALCF